MRDRLRSTNFIRLVSWIAWILVLIGLWKGARDIGTDFRVFYNAAKLASEGHANLLYREGPDRFLYAPGFAFLLIPLAHLEYPLAHLVWLLACVSALSFMMKLLARKIWSEGGIGELALAVAVIFLMRSVWIDLRYGQVNLLILAASVWALLTPTFFAWFFFSIGAFAKLYPLPLFLIPLLMLRKREDRVLFRPIFLGSLAGLGLLVLLPAILSSLPAATLYAEWYRGLLGRGFPLETHNQSFLAFLHRIFSGEIIRSHQTGGEPMLLLGRLLSPEAIQVVFWTAVIAILVLFFRSASRYVKRKRSIDLGLCIALCFIPTHLIWKPYFLLGIPLAAAIFSESEKDQDRKRSCVRLGVFFALFLIAHLSSAEVIGRHASAWYEAFSGFLWIHVALIALGARISSLNFKPVEIETVEPLAR